jgi:ketosteroid isomerase-like protein
MKNFATLSLAAVLMAVTAAGINAGAEEAADAEKQAVAEAVDGFYTALNAMFKGDVEPMKKVWSHSPDVTYMPPDGEYLKGWKATLKSWQEQASLNLGGVVKPEDLHYNIGETIAVVHNYEVGENFTGGERDIVKIRATNLFRKENGEWKMIGHHVDLLPFLIKKEKK